MLPEALQNVFQETPYYQRPQSYRKEQMHMTRRLAVVWSAVAAVVFAAGIAQAQTPTPAGHWVGTMSVQGKDLGLTMDIAKGDTGWRGEAGIVEMNATGLELSPITVNGESVTFVMKGIPGDPTFKGTLSKDGKTMSGDFTQGPVSGTFSLGLKGDAKLTPAVKNAAIAKEFEGSWEGAIDAGGTTLRLILKLANENGTARGSLVSVDQGNIEIPLREISQTGTKLTVTVPTVGGKYDAELKEGQLVGTWAQGPGTLPLTMKRAAK
jgi:hypothetical protein